MVERGGRRKQKEEFGEASQEVWGDIGKGKSRERVHSEEGKNWRRQEGREIKEE